MPNNTLSPITPFDNIKIASNESVDFYPLNRAFNRLYNAANNVVSSASATYTMTDIPYTTYTDYGYSKFASTMTSSDNLNIISSELLSSYIESVSLSSSLEYIENNSFKVCSGNGSIIDGIQFKIGYSPIISGTTSFFGASSIINTNTISFSAEAFTSLPIVSVQILDGSGNADKFNHKYIISNVSTSSFTYSVYTQKLDSIIPSKDKYYLSWLAIGV